MLEVMKIKDEADILKNKLEVGGMLTYSKIKEAINTGDIQISDFDNSCLNPNSYNLHLDNELKVYDRGVWPFRKPLDCRKQNPVKRIIIPESGILLKPGKLYLGSTKEITYTDKYIPCIDGRSSTGRLGLSLHVTAGFGDIGFKGSWTLEITVVEPLIIYPGEEICQIYWFNPCGDTEHKYHGRYQDQREAVESKLYKGKLEEYLYGNV